MLCKYCFQFFPSALTVGNRIRLNHYGVGSHYFHEPIPQTFPPFFSSLSLGPHRGWKEHVLRLQKTRVQFSAHTLGGSQPSVTSVPGCLMPLASVAPALIGTDSHTDEHTYALRVKQKCDPLLLRRLTPWPAVILSPVSPQPLLFHTGECVFFFSWLLGLFISHIKKKWPIQVSFAFA